MSSSDDEVNEVGSTSPLDRRNRKRQRNGLSSEHDKVFYAKRGCEVAGCESEGVRPLREDGLLTCKAHKARCSHPDCTAYTVDYALLCEMHIRERYNVRLVKLMIVLIPLLPNACVSYTILLSLSSCLPKVAALLLNSLRKTGQRPIWAYGHFADDVIQRYMRHVNLSDDLMGDFSELRHQELYNYFSFGEGTFKLQTMENEIYTKFIEMRISGEPPLSQRSLEGAKNDFLRMSDSQRRSG